MITVLSALVLLASVYLLVAVGVLWTGVILREELHLDWRLILRAALLWPEFLYVALRRDPRDE